MIVVQEPGELVLAVVTEALDPAPVALESTVVHHGPITATFHVIGASHLVEISVDGSTWFHETLSCLSIPSRSCLLHHDFSDLADYDAELASLGYRVQVQFSPQKGTLTETADPSQARDSIVFAFPPVFDQRPVTRIEWFTDETSLSWTTLHTYPHRVGATKVTSHSVLRVPAMSGPLPAGTTLGI
jgi:hypothetical protein